MLTVFVRAVILSTSVLAMRMMGKRQVGQLQPFELVVAIMIAELAATPMGSGRAPALWTAAHGGADHLPWSIELCGHEERALPGLAVRAAHGAHPQWGHL